jgi:hypothetical protein
MAPIEILSDVYIISKKKGTPEREFKEMDYFDKLKFLSIQEPKTFAKISYTAGNRVLYFPALGDYFISIKSDVGYLYENESDALFRANLTLEKISSLYSRIVFGVFEAKEIMGVKKVIEDNFKGYL